MKTKRIALKYKKERSLISDVLPYEVPVTFSNRHFYNFLISNKIEFKNGAISWHSNNPTLDKLVLLLFGIPLDSILDEKLTSIHDKQITIKSYRVDMLSIPFSYKISHKQNEYRELAIPHPRNQLQVAEFYHSCKELILYYCSVSAFSIRRPQRVSKYCYHKDRTHYKNLSDDISSVEEYDKEYESLRSFFVYKEHSNIYKFYESHKYHRCEKKYNKLLKLDISKCFDSIYTHSLAWAIFNKESTKAAVTESSKTFPGRFDKIMQQLNYNETNGIIIGPEFSRVFAELILQSADLTVLQRLLSEHKLKHKIDYEIFRYVDDYFIFYNKDTDKEKILEVLQITLKEYKLYLNSTKALVYEKPLITEISRAKQRISKLLNEKLIYNLEISETRNAEHNESSYRGSIILNSKQLIVDFKTIIKECAVEYKDMLNYSLSIVENKCENILKNYNKITKDPLSEKQLIQAILAILEFVFFIYSVSPRVNTTIKLCRILRIFSSFLTTKDSNADFRGLVFKYIFDEICFILKKNRNNEHTQVETLYLLIALSELGKDYWLEENSLANYFGIETVNERFKECPNFNYFSITVILFYMKEKKRYQKLRHFIEAKIIKKFQTKSKTLLKETELTMLLFDTLSCPYVSTPTKIEILIAYKITDPAAQSEIINLSTNLNDQLSFTTWKNFNFGKALDAKQSREVY